MNERKSYFRVYGIRLLVTFLFVISFMSATIYPAQAKTVHYYIQTTVDTQNWEIKATIIDDDCTALLGTLTEGKRINSSSLLNLFNNTSSALSLTNTSLDGAESSDKSKKYLSLTFPGNSDYSGTSADAQRAQAIIDYLLSDLNRAINLIWPDRSDWSLEVFRSKLELLITQAENAAGNFSFETADIDGTGVTISYCPSITEKEKVDDSVISSDYVILTADDIQYKFLIKMPKGYQTDSDGRTMPSGMSYSTDENAFIYWRTLAWEAIHNYTLAGDSQVTVDNLYSNGNVISNMLASAIKEICNGIRSLLNLWSADELIFNAGVRGTTAYEYGIFPTTWEPYIWAVFAIFEIIALMFLLYSIISIVTKKALSTGNALGRIQVWDNLKDLIVVAVLLALLPLILQIFLSLSSALTSIFYSALGGKSIVEVRSKAGTGGGIVGAIVELLYLGMDVYFNFYYMLRAIAITILIVIAPLCLIAMTFDNGIRKITSLWLKELLVNIFLQPIHAFLFVFVCILPRTGHGFDTIILMYSILPFTSTLRKILFGGAGESIDKAANAAKNKTTGAVAGVAALGVSGAKAIGGKISAGASAGAAGISASSSNSNDGSTTSNSESSLGQDMKASDSSFNSGSDSNSPSASPQKSGDTSFEESPVNNPNSDLDLSPSESDSSSPIDSNSSIDNGSSSQPENPSSNPSNVNVGDNPSSQPAQRSSAPSFTNSPPLNDDAASSENTPTSFGESNPQSTSSTPDSQFVSGINDYMGQQKGLGNKAFGAIGYAFGAGKAAATEKLKDSGTVGKVVLGTAKAVGSAGNIIKPAAGVALNVAGTAVSGIAGSKGGSSLGAALSDVGRSMSKPTSGNKEEPQTVDDV